MELVLYDRASTRTKRAMGRLKKKWGHINYYKPRKMLLERWKTELGWSEEQILEQLSKERRYLINHNYGIDFPF
jgi:hypothetical protein